MNIWHGLISAPKDHYMPTPAPKPVYQRRHYENTQQEEVLEAIKEHPGVSCNELFRRSTFSKNTMRGVIGRLLKLGLIEARHDATRHASYFVKELK